MGERLQKLLRELGFSSARFAEALDIQPSAVSHLISGRNKPGFDIIAKLLSRFPEINPRWLILGEEPMYVKETGTPGSEGIPLETTILFQESEKDDNAKKDSDAGNDPFPFNELRTSKEASVRSVIILYSDGKFESFEHK